MKVPAKGRSPYATVKELLGRGLREMAREVAEEEIKAHPKDPAPLRLLAQVMEEYGDFLETGRLCEEALKLAPDDLGTLAFATGAWFRSGHYANCLRCVRRVRELVPHNPDAWIEEARVISRLDGPEAALDLLRRMPAGVDNPALRKHVEGSIMIALKRDTEAEALLLEAARTDELTENMRMYAWFEVAKIRDRGGDYDGAWAAATEGHKLAGKKFDSAGYRQFMDAIRKVFDKKHMAQWARATKRNTAQVFVVGMPRSGTTLLEQILSMHPSVANGGELAISTLMQRRLSNLTDSFLPWPRSIADLQERDADALQEMYLAAVATLGEGKERVTNKSLVLQHHLGLLELSLPGCYSIMLHRHPLDNMVSCYTTDLVGSGHHYCSDVRTLAEVWIARREMQDFWSESLDREPLQLHYEELVANQEAESRRIVKFLDLEWNEACLSFHKSTRMVATISRDQVTRKMYTTSKGRWRNYEKFLEPAMGLLSKYL